MSDLTHDEDAVVEGAGATTSGSAWMFYNHYNPDLLKAVQLVLVGENIVNVVDTLVEKRLPLSRGGKVALGASAVSGLAIGAYLGHKSRKEMASTLKKNAEEENRDYDREQVRKRR